jgi:hypothetical protein
VGSFLVSNASAVAYALVNKADWMLASMFLANAVGCAAILLIGRGSVPPSHRQLQEPA